MEDTVKKTSVLGRILVWFLVISTVVVIYMTIKLFVAAQTFRST